MDDPKDLGLLVLARADGRLREDSILLGFLKATVGEA
jgi:hypothetical protein